MTITKTACWVWFEARFGETATKPKLAKDNSQDQNTEIKKLERIKMSSKIIRDLLMTTEYNPYNLIKAGIESCYSRQSPCSFIISS